MAASEFQVKFMMQLAVSMIISDRSDMKVDHRKENNSLYRQRNDSKRFALIRPTFGCWRGLELKVKMEIEL